MKYIRINCKESGRAINERRGYTYTQRKRLTRGRTAKLAGGGFYIGIRVSASPTNTQKPTLRD
jgi:hypothetical protein